MVKPIVLHFENEICSVQVLKVFVECLSFYAGKNFTNLSSKPKLKSFQRIFLFLTYEYLVCVSHKFYIYHLTNFKNRIVVTEI